VRSASCLLVRSDERFPSLSNSPHLHAQIYAEHQKKNVYVDLHGLLATPLNHIAGYENLIMVSAPPHNRSGSHPSCPGLAWPGVTTQVALGLDAGGPQGLSFSLSLLLHHLGHLQVHSRLHRCGGQHPRHAVHPGKAAQGEGLILLFPHRLIILMMVCLHRINLRFWLQATTCVALSRTAHASS